MKKGTLRVAETVDETCAYIFVCALEDREMDKERFHQVWLEMLQDSSIQHYFLMDESEEVGFCSLRVRTQLHHCARVAEVEEFIVSEDKRRLQYGSFMFQEIKRIAQEKGCIQLELSSRDTRTIAHHFYRAQGMAQCHLKFTANLR